MEDLAALKPMPEPSRESKPYWDGLKEHRLMLQRCGDCGRIRHYPRPVCAHCHSMRDDWVEASGAGAIHSWAVCHHPFNPGFKAETPYILLTVDLAEGVRLCAPLRGGQEADVAIGRAVEVIFETQSDELCLPAFRLA